MFSVGEVWPRDQLLIASFSFNILWTYSKCHRMWRDQCHHLYSLISLSSWNCFSTEKSSWKYYVKFKRKLSFKGWDMTYNTIFYEFEFSFEGKFAENIFLFKMLKSPDSCWVLFGPCRRVFPPWSTVFVPCIPCRSCEARWSRSEHWRSWERWLRRYWCREMWR